MVGDLSVILDPLVFLIFGIFLALWLFGILGNAFMDFAEARIRFSKTELSEIRQLVAIAKSYGVRLDKSKIIKEQKAKKKKATFERLSKKYGAFETLEAE